ncbi:MAG: hypothetical protein WBM78_00325 [Desulfobacterales bacterium]
MKPKIFVQEQIARAAELGLSASAPAEIDLVAANEQIRIFLANNSSLQFQSTRGICAFHPAITAG